MTSLDFLYIALGVGFLLLTIFGSIAVFYMIFILRDVSKATDSIRDTAEKLNEYILSPIKVANAVIERAKPIYDAIQRKRSEMEERMEEKVEKARKRK